MSAVAIDLGPYHIAIDTTSGKLTGLRRGSSPNALGHGPSPATLGAELAYQPIQEPARYRRHSVGGSTLAVEVELGPLVLMESYTAAAGWLERRVTVENVSSSEVQLTGVRLGLGGVSLGDPAGCLFEAPANVVRPRLPLSVAAGRPVRPGAADRDQYDLHFAPGLVHRHGAAVGDAPDVGPGLLIVTNPELGWSLLTWYFSSVESARPWVGGDGTHAALGFDLGLAGWLPPGGRLAGGSQFILLHPGNYQSALAAYRGSFEHTGVLPPVYPHLDGALDWAGIYEVHPGQFGGFAGLRQALPTIRKMGFDTLYLLPVHPYRNKTNLPWDENWETSGSPYAIHDFRQLEPSLGTASDFSALVETAHDLGLRVLMDLVLQGSSLESRYVAEHPEWYARDEQGRMVHSHGWNDTWSFDWANPAYQQFVLNYALGYVKRHAVDGFRVDAPHGKEPNWDRNIPYHASATNLGTAALLEELRLRLRVLKPDAALFCELFGPLWVRSHDIALDFHPWAMALQLFERRLTPYEFGEYLRDYWAVMPHTADGLPAPRACFTESHDTRSWPAYALRGSRIEQALLGILVMAGFVPLLFCGQEADQVAFIRGLVAARAASRALRRGQWLWNAVTIDDEDHYRRQQGDAPAEQVFSLVRHTDGEILFGVASLLPEQATFRFGLPVEELPVSRGTRYHLRDLITGQVWNEYGQTEWRGKELASFYLTPRMYRPYIFRLEPVM